MNFLNKISNKGFACFGVGVSILAIISAYFGNEETKEQVLAAFQTEKLAITETVGMNYNEYIKDLFGFAGLYADYEKVQEITQMNPQDIYEAFYSGNYFNITNIKLSLGNLIAVKPQMFAAITHMSMCDKDGRILRISPFIPDLLSRSDIDSSTINEFIKSNRDLFALQGHTDIQYFEDIDLNDPNIIEAIKLYSNPESLISERKVGIERIINSGQSTLELLFPVKSGNQTIGALNLNVSNMLISQLLLKKDNGDLYSIVSSGRIIADTNSENIGRVVQNTIVKHSNAASQDIYPGKEFFTMDFRIFGSNQTSKLYIFPNTTSRDKLIKTNAAQLYGGAFLISIMGFLLSGLGFLYKKNQIELDARTVAEEKLKEELVARVRAERGERKLLYAIESLPYGVAMTEDGATFSYANPEFLKMHSLSSDGMIGRHIFDLVPEKYREELLNHIRIVNEKGQHEFELEHLCDDGTFIGLHKVIAKKKETGELEYRIVLLEDVTERIEERKEHEATQAALRQNQKMEAIGTLAGGIAHDFNNVLSIIISYGELALMDKGEDSEDYTNLNAILSAASRAKDLVSQILYFARKDEEELKPIRIDMSVKEAYKFSRSIIPSTIEMRENIEQGIKIMGDPIKIYQLVLNLAANASHAMEENGGTLHVQVERIFVNEADLPTKGLTQEGPYAKISVTDTGIGMDSETLERIYEPFFTTKDSRHGTGFGLSIVYKIVKEHNGEIKCYSEPGRGTSFHIYIPEIESDIHALDLEYELKRGTERVLVVDDEEPIAESICGQLRKLGYDPVPCSDPLVARKKLEDESIDLLFTDMTMPKMTGDQLSQYAVKQNIPTIVCTGFSTKMNPDKAKKTGIKAYLVKPVSLRILSDTVRSVIDGTYEYDS